MNLVSLKKAVIRSLLCLAIIVMALETELPTIASAQTHSVITLAAGETFSMALLSDGTIRTWGWNKYGQLGMGNNTASNRPASVVSLTEIKAVAAGSFFGMALKNDGTVWAWGDNHYGQLGNGANTDSTVPVKVSDLSEVIAIAAGSNHGMALKKDGTVWVWGSNEYGQLGDDDTNSEIPVRIANLTGVVAISTGGNHNLVLKQDGTVWSWGWNFIGQLGHSYNPEAEFDDFAPPQQVASLTDVMAVSAGGSHNLALKRDGTVWSWGNNGFGQLGYPTDEIVNAIPKQITGLDNIIAVAAGTEHSLALKRDGSILAWGNNAKGQLGNRNEKEVNRPVPVSGFSRVTSLVTGGHVLAMKTDGTIWGWGNNQFGQVSGGMEDAIFQPIHIEGL